MSDTKKKNNRNHARTKTNTSKSTNSSNNTRKKSVEEMNEFQDRRAFEQGLTMFIAAIITLICYISMFGVAGPIGLVVGGGLLALFGWLAWFVPACSFLAIIFVMVNPKDSRVPRRIGSGIGIGLTLMAITDMISSGKIYMEYYNGNKLLHNGGWESVSLSLKDVLTHGSATGGIVGRGVYSLFSAMFGNIGAGVVLFAVLLFSIYIFYGIEWMAKLRRRNAFYQEMESNVANDDSYSMPSYQVKKPRVNPDAYSDRQMQAVDLALMGQEIDRQESLQQKNPKNEPVKEPDTAKKGFREMKEIVPDKKSGSMGEPMVPPVPAMAEIPVILPNDNMEVAAEPEDSLEQKETAAKKPRKPRSTIASKQETEKAVEDFAKANAKGTEGEKEYQFPPLDLLATAKNSNGKMTQQALRETADRLQETLQSFGVNVTMSSITCGPTVTRYELIPEQGVRVNKITNLTDDLKLSLAASSIRIEAPIPGKSAVGIEVPNDSASAVYFRELLEGESFQSAKSPVTFAVGKDITGDLIMTDIAKMPHLLIAGATGSGKSVCINTLIMSIIYKANPSDVKMIMIDPKVVELSVYNGIPHLFCPVVTDPKEAAAALNWAVREMMERYNKFKELGVRNIDGYNQKIKTVEHPEAAGYEKMPLLVVIVDEFADLMMVASKEVEDAVCRLAQLARAAGIHLVLATQRPSVNVITGVIKANIPSRIAFSVSSAIDSRTILDKGGAEHLLGKGDMLFFPSGFPEPVRVQGAFISDKEVSDVVEFLKQSNDQPEYNTAVTEVVETTTSDANSNEDKKSEYDEYFEDAGRFVIESERAAAGQLQRRFSIGFNRAGRIIDQLHQAGVVGPSEGTKPRKILMTLEQFEAFLNDDKSEPSTDSEPLQAESAESMYSGTNHIVTDGSTGELI